MVATSGPPVVFMMFYASYAHGLSVLKRGHLHGVTATAP